MALQFKIPESGKIKQLAGRKNRVDSLIPEAASIAFTTLRADIFIGVRDVDTHEEINAVKIKDSWMAHIPHDYHHKIIPALPVQCIEHWLWYIKLERKDEKHHQYLETRLRTTAKIEVYGTLKPGKLGKEKVVDLCSNFDFENITHKSKSFLAFHTSIEKFIKSHIEKTK